MGKRTRQRTTPNDVAGICLHSNAPWAGTGYGVQTAALARALKRSGRPVVISCNYGLQGGVSDWEGVPVLPVGNHPYSIDTLVAHTEHATQLNGRPTALLTLFDVWVYKQANVDTLPLVASWVPVDHVPVPDDVHAWCERPNVLPIAMARFGAEEIRRRGVECAYVPHGVDTKVFTPDATVDGKTGRELLNLPPDAFVVGMVAANKGQAPLRKAWGENFLAMAEFMQRHNDVVLYVHSEKHGSTSGISLVKLAEACGIPTDRIAWVDQWAYYAGLPASVLATIMGAFDVHLLASRGEGFGVPVLEASACGVPSIVSDFTAQPELVAGSGWVTAVQPYWDAPQGAWFCTPLIHSLVEQLEHAYEDARNPARRAAARAHAETYDHRAVFAEYWEPTLATIDERMSSKAAA